MNRAGNMDVDAWRENQIRKRVQARIDESTGEFLKEYGEATDRELKEYIRGHAGRLGRMPHPLELPGGLYIHKRLGDWDALALSLGLRPVEAGKGKKLYHRMLEEEKKLFMEERRALKAEKEKKRTP